MFKQDISNVTSPDPRSEILWYLGFNCGNQQLQLLLTYQELGSLKIWIVVILILTHPVELVMMCLINKMSTNNGSQPL